MDTLKGISSEHKPDKTDVEIMKYLQLNGRFNIKEMTESLHMSKTPIYERIRRLESAGYIKDYVVLLDRKKLGVPLLVFCAVSLNVQNAEQIALFNEQVRGIEEIVECYLTGGVFDFVLKVIVQDLEAYNNFASKKLATIPNVGKIQSSFVLDEIKSTTAIPF